MANMTVVDMKYSVHTKSHRQEQAPDHFDTQAHRSVVLPHLPTAGVLVRIGEDSFLSLDG